MSTPEAPERSRDGYPSEAELRYVEEADWIKLGPQLLFTYVSTIWSSYGWTSIEKRLDPSARPCRVITLVTGGWSGNEDIISSLRRACLGIPWGSWWLESKRGGYFAFEVPEQQWTDWGSS